MLDPNSSDSHKLIDSFKILQMTPEGQMIMQYLQGVFLYPNAELDQHFGTAISKEEILGHHRVILHMLTLMNQETR